MGGGTVRAAAKATMNGGFRSAAYFRRTIMPASSSSSSTTAAADTRPASPFAVDDWVIPDRDVFSPVPTHEEAMSATIDLRDAFEIAKVESHGAHLDISKAQLTHNDLDGPTKVARDTAHPDLVHSGTSFDLVHSETPQHDGVSENLNYPSVSSGRVVEAFAMLQESPEVQDVVASLASDQNVWEAVMKNPKLMQYYKTCGTNIRESSNITEDGIEGSEAESVQSSSEILPSAGDASSDYVEKMKAFVSEMVTNISSIMQDLVATTDKGQTKGRLRTLIISSKNDFANAPSTFVILAIASIFVVLLKSA